MRKMVSAAPLGVCLAAGLLAGCASQNYERAVAVEPTAMAQFLADKPEPTRRLYRRVLEEGDRNLVLNQMRSGLAAMQVGDRVQAAASFDVALNRIEAVYADNEAAEKARSLWFKESIKDFKGEGYERAMAYYYRGLLYLMAEDYENARASFKAGQLQDTFAEDQRYSADFASLSYLEGWADHCLKQEGPARESFAEAARNKPVLAAPRADDNVLVVVEYGTAPRKVAAGQHSEALVYQAPAQMRLFSGNQTATGSVIDLRPDVAADAKGAPVVVKPIVAEDLLFQARTRGGRQVDQILEGKASFKEGTETTGKIATAAGYGTLYAGLASGNDNMAYAGGAALLVGLLVQAAADSMRAEADIRQWDNLPAAIALGTAQVSAKPSAEVHYVSVAGDDVVPSRSAQVAGGRCWIVWDRSHSALSVPDSAPGAVVR